MELLLLLPQEILLEICSDFQLNELMKFSMTCKKIYKFVSLFFLSNINGRNQIDSSKVFVDLNWRNPYTIFEFQNIFRTRKSTYIDFDKK